MATCDERSVTVILTSEHLRKMVDGHLLAEDELDNRAKMAGIVQKLVDTGLGLPDRPWHDWDDWVKGFDL